MTVNLFQDFEGHGWRWDIQGGPHKASKHHPSHAGAGYGLCEAVSTPAHRWHQVCVGVNSENVCVWGGDGKIYTLDYDSLEPETHKPRACIWVSAGT